MKSRISRLVFLILSLFIPTVAQQQSRPATQDPPPKTQADEQNKNVVRISVTLVQVDVTVTDKKASRSPISNPKTSRFSRMVTLSRSQTFLT